MEILCQRPLMIFLAGIWFASKRLDGRYLGREKTTRRLYWTQYQNCSDLPMRSSWTEGRGKTMFTFEHIGTAAEPSVHQLGFRPYCRDGDAQTAGLFRLPPLREGLHRLAAAPDRQWPFQLHGLRQAGARVVQLLQLHRLEASVDPAVQPRGDGFCRRLVFMSAKASSAWARKIPMLKTARRVGASWTIAQLPNRAPARAFLSNCR